MRPLCYPSQPSWGDWGRCIGWNVGSLKWWLYRKVLKMSLKLKGRNQSLMNPMITTLKFFFNVCGNPHKWQSCNLELWACFWVKLRCDYSHACINWAWSINDPKAIRELTRLGFPHSSVGKESACNVGKLGSITGSGRSPPLEKGMATPSSILAWRIPGTDKLSGPQSMGSQESDTTEWLNHQIG